MADNYLEKRMDDYRSGRLRVSHSSSTARLAASRRSGEMVVEFPPMRILVVSASLSEQAVALVEEARRVGLRVAVLSDNRVAATALVQRTGARFYPSMSPEAVTEDICRHWGGLDAVFAEGEFRGCGCPVRSVPEGGNNPALTARFCLLSVHPDNTVFTIS